MSRFDWEPLRRAKDEQRAIAAARPLREKLEILDKLRVRTEQLKKLRPKPRPAAPRFAHVHLMEESPTAALEHAGRPLIRSGIDDTFAAIITQGQQTTSTVRLISA